MSEQRLVGSYEQMVIALAERRQRILEDGNRQIAAIGAALDQVVKDAARAAGMAETAQVEQRADGLWLVEKTNAEDAGGTAVA